MSYLTTVHEGLISDVRDHVLTNLPCQPEERSALEALRVDDLLSAWLNWQGRLIAAKPRRVHVSRALGGHPLAKRSDIARALDMLTGRIARGEPLTPFLSRRILIGFERQKGKVKALNRRRDLDLLLND